jgi:cell division protein FtsW
MDMGVFAAVLALLGFGVVLVYSSSFALAQDRFGGAGFFLERQAIRVLIALVAFVVFMNVDYHVWGKFNGVFYAVAIGLLLAVLALPGSAAVNGAKRWLTLGPVQFQVSDFARLALIILLAARCERAGESLRDIRTFGLLLARAGAICVLVALEPNFSTAALLGVLALAMLYAGGARLTHIAGLILAGIPLAAIFMLSAPYRRARVMTFLGMGEHVERVGYQAQQALIGLGNGGLFGEGLGQGTQKYFYLPEPHTDFAFSILGEEIGLVGLVLVLAVFGFIVYRGFRIAVYAPDKTGQLMAFGVSLVLGLYVLIHAAVNVGLMPTTGVPLPLLSYGGVSIILTMMGMGMLLNISSQARQTPVASAGRRAGR